MDIDADDDGKNYGNLQQYPSTDLYTHCTDVSGMGVFTRKVIQKGTIITTVAGEKISIDEYERLSIMQSYKLRYTIFFNSKNIFQPLHEPVVGRGLGSFINNGGHNNAGKNNCKFSYSNKDDVVYVRTTKIVKAYHELFIPYGTGYKWKTTASD